jgi:hypothetical protein
MLLTKKDLKEYQVNMRVYISDDLAKELLEIYGTVEIDDEGHSYEFTEQDIYEQLRKIIPDKKLSTIEINSEGRPYLR